MRISALLAACVALLVACGSERDSIVLAPTVAEIVTVDIDHVYDAKHQALADRAAAKWREMANVRSIASKPGGTWLMLSATCFPGFLGWTQLDHHIIRVDPSLESNDDEFYAVVLHEYGHILGLHHTREGVMCGPDVREGNTACVGFPTEFSIQDRAECWRAGACD